MKTIFTIFTIIITLFIFQNNLFGQKRIDSLVGEWKLEKYFSPQKNSEVKNSEDNGCENFLIIKVNENKRLKLIFTNNKDSFVFSGKIVFLKNGTIKLKNNIHEIVYLDELEKCITPSLRMEIRGILYRTYQYSIKENQLHLIFNLPEDIHSVKQMVFQRIN
ncbi:MAG: hypothetical protein J7604_07970 [Sporocytophaga sp.]|uniref:hypothetical protein n=1 Tax=Sporocytophaga sp. TaxID=2231183 RepID=UPI001B2B97E2|nr:hypothetical protein [Sporocytophaga sp.]MBO9700134.1 hypothetical protein [Sporocytophaga sp.]